MSALGDSLPVDPQTLESRKRSEFEASQQPLVSFVHVNPLAESARFEMAGWDVAFMYHKASITAEVVIPPECLCVCPPDLPCSTPGEEWCFCEGCKHNSRHGSHDVERRRSAIGRAHCDPQCPGGSGSIIALAEKHFGWVDRSESIHAAPIQTRQSGGESFAVAVECKPDLGDDYPTVLRQVKRYLADRRCPSGAIPVVVARRAMFSSVTYEEVVAIFAASGIRLVMESNVERWKPEVERQGWIVPALTTGSAIEF